MINPASDALAPPGLASFGEELSAVVIGASGSLGSAFVEALEAAPAVTRVAALSRRPVASLSPKTTWQAIDLESEESIAEAARRLGAERQGLHLVIVASGLRLGADRPPQTGAWRGLDTAGLHRAFAVNAIGPALVAKHFLPLLARSRKTAFAALSARVGGADDSRAGGLHAYRASKAALNMLIRTLAVELARSNPDAVCVALHPGAAGSGLSRTLQGGRSAEELFSPVLAATRLLGVLDGLSPGHSGGLFTWDGQRISF